AVPSHFFRRVIRSLKQYDLQGKIILSVTKGIESSTLMRMSEVIEDELGKVKLAVLSGPTIAKEVAMGIPTTAVIASRDLKIAKKLQQIFNNGNFRVYTNSDLIGVELGGSLKNVIAIACGVSDGLGFGTNTKAAILSRGLTEMSRLGKVLGAKGNTFSGISGLGDLVTTCISPFSRNRFVGEQLGKGKSLKEILKKMQMIAEGVETAKSVYKLSNKYKVSMPITLEVYNILYRNKNPKIAVQDLMRRKLKAE
ncbi:MAG: NAD(P)H-dependent glycerol-3-phosphate dehydrogenase, partial [Candidatus Omnitrophota bacterium]|nr:NAD(P)H-dependent glycerol-3-phosphate dehydrogenase [Candidatus Omnitrophota bacterium]